MRSAALLAVVAISLASLASADTKIRPGRWEVTGKMDFGGMQLPPGMPMAQPITGISCISEAEAKAEDISVPQNSKCTMGEKKITGSQISFTMKCEGGSTMKVDTTIQSPEAYSGTMLMQGGPAGGHTMTMKFNGKRTGDACSPEEQAEDDARNK